MWAAAVLTLSRALSMAAALKGSYMAHVLDLHCSWW